MAVNRITDIDLVKDAPPVFFSLQATHWKQNNGLLSETWQEDAVDILFGIQVFPVPSHC